MKKLIAAMAAFTIALIPTTVMAGKSSPSVTSAPEVNPTVVGRMADGTCAYLDWAPEDAKGYLLVYQTVNSEAEKAAVAANSGYNKLTTYEVQAVGIDPAAVEIDITVPAKVASGESIKVIHVNNGMKNDYAGHMTGYVTFHIDRGEGLSPFVILTNGVGTAITANPTPLTDVR